MRHPMEASQTKGTEQHSLTLWLNSPATGLCDAAQDDTYISRSCWLLVFCFVLFCFLTEADQKQKAYLQ